MKIQTELQVDSSVKCVLILADFNRNLNDQIFRKIVRYCVSLKFVQRSSNCYLSMEGNNYGQCNFSRHPTVI
jgi:hypothetical protein